MADYPQNLIRTRELSDGRAVTIRPIRPEDIEIEQDFVRHLSEESRYSRFMSQLHELSANKLKYFTDIDYDRHLALIAVAIEGDREVEVGVARYVALPPHDCCEFAIAVDDAWQGSGVGRLLLTALMEAARERGFRSMKGMVLATNHRMLGFVRQFAFSVHGDAEDPGTVTVERQI